MVMIVAQSVGIPAEGMGLILGVDRFLDMCRTAVNVSGDLVIAAGSPGTSSEPIAAELGRSSALADLVCQRDTFHRTIPA